MLYLKYKVGELKVDFLLILQRSLPVFAYGSDATSSRVEPARSRISISCIGILDAEN